MVIRVLQIIYGASRAGHDQINHIYAERRQREQSRAEGNDHIISEKNRVNASGENYAYKSGMRILERSGTKRAARREKPEKEEKIGVRKSK